MDYTEPSIPTIRWGHTYKAGTVFEYVRPNYGAPQVEPTIFVLLEDRCITPEDVMDEKAEALCLILMGRVYEALPGMVVSLKGIIDASEEIG